MRSEEQEKFHDGNRFKMEFRFQGRISTYQDMIRGISCQRKNRLETQYIDIGK